MQLENKDKTNDAEKSQISTNQDLMNEALKSRWHVETIQEHKHFGKYRHTRAVPNIPSFQVPHRTSVGKMNGKRNWTQTRSLFFYPRLITVFLLLSSYPHGRLLQQRLQPVVCFSFLRSPKICSIFQSGRGCKKSFVWPSWDRDTKTNNMLVQITILLTSENRRKSWENPCVSFRFHRCSGYGRSVWDGLKWKAWAWHFLRWRETDDWN